MFYFLMPGRVTILSLILLCYPAIAQTPNPLTLQALLEAATAVDPWLERSRDAESALRHDAVAAGALPDPKLNVALANLPLDSFSFSQEPMTQLNIGVSQAFPAGQTRSLQRQRLEEMGDVNPIARTVRTKALRRQISAVWLEASLAARSITLIESDRALFDQLLEVTRASYGNAVGRVNQQDIIRAQLELTRLDERILRLEETKARKLGRLSEWVPGELLASGLDWSLPSRPLADAPSIGLPPLLAHPEIVLIDQQIEVARTVGALARASRRPGWSLNTSYAYRDEDLTGRDLPDFFSVGISVDLPLFAKNRQDKRVDAAADRVNELLSSRVLKLRELQARRADSLSAIDGLEEQWLLYSETLLGQLGILAQSALDAYAADQGDFADVMRAYIAQLNARIEVLKLETQIADQYSELEYLTAQLPRSQGVSE